MDKALFGETWNFTQVYLSCPVEITKELYITGETQKLSSYYHKADFEADSCKELVLKIVA